MAKSSHLYIQLGTLLGMLAAVFAVTGAAPATAQLTADDRAFLEDVEHRGLRFFLEQADANTGMIRDRARTDGVVETAHDRDVSSIASVGFGLSAFVIGAEHKWISHDEARSRTLTTLRFFASQAPSEHGWFYHFMTPDGQRKWKSELSSIDTALLLAGILTARQYFSGDKQIADLADTIYNRVDFRWMQNGNPRLLAMGWHPESGFIRGYWDHYCELMIMYLLAIASPSHGIPTNSWYAWSRPPIDYEQYHYIYGDRPLFVHQYSHAWIDFRGRRENRAPGIEWFQNSVTATLAQREYCTRLAARFPKYGPNMWGLTASDSAHGYVAWGGPPDDPHVDGSVVPCAPGGSLMFTPRESLGALRNMKQLYGDRIYGRYGFTDAFNPNTGWVNPDVIGIDVGITVLSAENLLTGNVWKWFMSAPHIRETLDRVGVTAVAQ